MHYRKLGECQAFMYIHIFIYIRPVHNEEVASAEYAVFYMMCQLLWIYYVTFFAHQDGWLFTDSHKKPQYIVDDKHLKVCWYTYDSQVHIIRESIFGLNVQLMRRRERSHLCFFLLVNMFICMDVLMP